MHLTLILKTKVAYWANLAVTMTNDTKEQDIWAYYYLQLADTVQNILKDICIWIIREQCSDQGEYQQKQ